jgi:hypothetical protein
MKMVTPCTSRKQGGKILGGITRADAERLLLDWVNLPDLSDPAKSDDAFRRLIARNPQLFGQDAQNIPDFALAFLAGFGAADVEMDFTTWYGGFCGLAQLIDSGVALPTTEEMVEYILQKVERARAAIAAGITWSDLVELRDLLRRAWDVPDRRRKDWYLFQLRARVHTWKTLVEFFRAHPQHVRLAPVPSEAILKLSKLTAIEPPPVTPFEATVIYFQTAIADLTKHCGNSDCPAPYFIAKKKWQKYCTEKCAGPAARESKRKWWQENRAKNGGWT